MKEAYEAIRPHGIGEAGANIRWYRLIEAETITRLKSEVIELTPWLTLELVPDETDGFAERLSESCLDACETVAQRLGWDHSTPTRISILARETDAPWATNPYGYCVEKEPYAKICLPDHLIEDDEEFAQAVAHEYAHVVSLSLSDENAPRWLEEAVSVLVENRVDQEATALVVEKWLSPLALEDAFEGTGGSSDSGQDVWLAYQQAGWIGRYLASLGSEALLGKLLREHAHEGIWRNLALMFQGKERVDAAVAAVYGTTVPEVFARARDLAAAQGLERET